MESSKTYFFIEDWGSTQAAYAAALALFVKETARLNVPFKPVVYPDGRRLFDEDLSHESFRTSFNTLELMPTIVPNLKHLDERRPAWFVRSLYHGDTPGSLRMTPKGSADFNEYKNRR